MKILYTFIIMFILILTGCDNITISKTSIPKEPVVEEYIIRGHKYLLIQSPSRYDIQTFVLDPDYNK